MSISVIPTPVSIQHLRKLWPDLNPSCPVWVKKLITQPRNIAVQGHIVGLRRLEHSMLLNVDDGFDVILVKCKLAENMPVHGDYVRIVGKCQLYRRELQIWAYQVELLAEIDDLAWTVELSDFWKLASIERRGKSIHSFPFITFSRAINTHISTTFRWKQPPSHFSSALPLLLP